MSIIQKLLGGPGYFMEADEATLASIKPVETKPKAPKADPPKAPEPKVEEVAAKAPAVEPATAPVTPSEAAVTETVTEVVTIAEEPPVETTSVKKSRKKKAAKASEAVVADPIPSGEVTGVLTDIQALVDEAIAQSNTEVQASENVAAERTFATDYLLVNSMKGRRKPGPSLTGFMDMAGTMRR